MCNIENKPGEVIAQGLGILGELHGVSRPMGPELRCNFFRRIGEGTFDYPDESTHSPHCLLLLPHLPQHLLHPHLPPALAAVDPYF